MHLNKNNTNVGDLQVFISKETGLYAISADASQNAVELTREQVVILKDNLNKLDLSWVASEDEL